MNSLRNNSFPMAIVVIAALATTIGCRHVIRRGQSPDESFTRLRNEETKTRFVGDVCGVKGLRPAQIEGIGLVVGLEGTGSEPAPSGQKDYLLRELKNSKTTDNAKKALASPNTAMVMLRGLIPAGAKKGDPIDLDVVTLPKTDTTSLKYGELLPTDLRPMAFLSRSVKLGNVMGKAQGRVLTDSLFDNRSDEKNLVKGRILGGGVVSADRDLNLVINSKDSTVKLTRSIAHSINQRYNTYTSSGRQNTANPVTDRIIELKVPKEYQHNLGRFIQALQAMAYGESVDDRVNRLDDLDRRITDPETAQRAAIELEALGEEGLPSLRRAIENPDFEVRFLAAEALAYQGDAAGIPHLKLAAESEPAFRWHALTALASINSKLSRDALADLFHVQSAETRYGAFRALQACRKDDSRVAGQKIGNEFLLHAITSKGPSLIHFSRKRRPEIVIFGLDPTVADNFMFVDAGITAKATGDGRVKIVRYGRGGKKHEVHCSNSLDELIKVLSHFDLGYTSMIDMCREADGSGTLNARLVFNAAPKIGSKSMDDSVAGAESDREQSDRYISGPAPGLFSDVDTDSDAVASESE